MKVTKATKIYRPLRLWGELIKDLFFENKKESTYKWCRYKIYFKSSEEQKKYNNLVLKTIKNQQLISNENN